MTTGTDAAAAVARERELLDPAVRGALPRVEALLHEDFTELGRSGRLWSRAEMLESIGALDTSTVDTGDMSGKLISPGVVLVTYTTRRDAETTFRSSIWLLTESGWRIRFHQATPL